MSMYVLLCSLEKPSINLRFGHKAVGPMRALSLNKTTRVPLQLFRPWGGNIEYALRLYTYVQCTKTRNDLN